MLFKIFFIIISLINLNLYSQAIELTEEISISDTLENETPGSISIIDNKELSKQIGTISDVNSILKQVPGVNLTTEDGFGLRPNIGFRGVSPERSANINLTEDQVLISPAPYSAPSAYYFPSIGRISGLEVIKGSNQTAYGPRTIAGTLNLKSTKIPEEFKFNLESKLGSYNSNETHTYLGESFKNFGWLLEGYNSNSDGFKSLPNSKNTGFEIEDYLAKIKLNSNPEDDFYQSLELKIHNYNQDSNETYLGLTKEDFFQNPNQRYLASELDNIKVDHQQYQLKHNIELSDNSNLETTAYINKTSRNWYKLQSVNGNSLSSIFNDNLNEELSALKGEGSAADVFTIRANNRKYESKGIQSKYEYEFGKDIKHKLSFGFRFHQDYEDRFQLEDEYSIINNTMELTQAGLAGSNANRISSAKAYSYFITDSMNINKLTINTGLRFEDIEFKRFDYGKSNPDRLSSAVDYNFNSVSELLPSASISYKLSKNTNIFSGIHKGFSPPGPSSTKGIKEETSINYEIGIKHKSKNLKAELISFYNNYENLLGSDSLAAGGTGSGDLFNAGEAKTYGIEALIDYDLNNYFNFKNIKLPFYSAYTLTYAKFNDNFDSELYGLVDSGDSIPYIPKNNFFTSLGLEYKKTSLSFNSTYFDSMLVSPNSLGIKGTDSTEAAVISDLNLNYKVNEKLSLFTQIQNITDKSYISSLRPAGARPNLKRTLFFGFKLNL